MEHEYNTVEEALEDLKQGKIVLVTDDENRENEGDMICAAEFATQENINFMASYAKGLICTPMSVELAEKLGFVPMVTKNTDNHETAFTVSIDYKDTTTGISAAERGLTMRMCVDENVSPEDFRKPGHFHKRKNIWKKRRTVGAVLQGNVNIFYHCLKHLKLRPASVSSIYAITGCNRGVGVCKIAVKNLLAAFVVFILPSVIIIYTPPGIMIHVKVLHAACLLFFINLHE